MSIRVLFFASLADTVGMKETAIDAATAADAGSVFNLFVGQFPALESHRSSVMIAINAEFARPGASVKDGDEIAFFPPVSGG
jgi:molybdopterin converting factor subunit 1